MYMTNRRSTNTALCLWAILCAAGVVAEKAEDSNNSKSPWTGRDSLENSDSEEGVQMQGSVLGDFLARLINTHYTTDSKDTSGEAEKRTPFDEVGSGFIGKRTPFDEIGSGFIGKRTPFDEIGSGFIGKRTPFDEIGSGFIGKRAPFDEIGSGFIGKRTPFDEIGSGFIGKRKAFDEIGSGFIGKRFPWQTTNVFSSLKNPFNGRTAKDSIGKRSAFDEIGSGFIGKRSLLSSKNDGYSGKIDHVEKRSSRRSRLGRQSSRNHGKRYWRQTRPFDEIGSGLIG